jgi:hypothetical protein
MAVCFVSHQYLLKRMSPNSHCTKTYKRNTGSTRVSRIMQLLVQCKHYSREEERACECNAANMAKSRKRHAPCTSLACRIRKTKKPSRCERVSFVHICAVHKRWYGRVDPFHLDLRRHGTFPAPRSAQYTQAPCSSHPLGLSFPDQPTTTDLQFRVVVEITSRSPMIPK